MCGRAYQTYTQEELSLRYLNKKPLDLPDFKPNYNLAPTQLCPVIVQLQAEDRQLKLFRWGLIPHWSKDQKSAYKMINARSETVMEKPSFRNAILQRRCILPLSGFYEWRREGNVKRPFAIFLKNETMNSSAPPTMSVAGIWETWGENPPDGTMDTFSILTTEANSFMHPLHDRMPVILAPKAEEEWLDPSLKDPLRLKKFFKPCPSSWLGAYEVSTLLNNPRNNTPEVLKPIKSYDSGVEI